MSLRSEPIGEIPDETARGLRGFSKVTIVTRLRDEFNVLYDDEGCRRLASPHQSGLVLQATVSEAVRMTTTLPTYHRNRFPAEIISHAVWLYHVFSLSLRDVELLLPERGIGVTHEAIRRWSLKFGSEFARRLRRWRPTPGDIWYLDEGSWRLSGILYEGRC